MVVGGFGLVEIRLLEGDRERGIDGGLLWALNCPSAVAQPRKMPSPGRAARVITKGIEIALYYRGIRVGPQFFATKNELGWRRTSEMRLLFISSHL